MSKISEYVRGFFPNRAAKIPAGSPTAQTAGVNSVYIPAASGVYVDETRALQNSAVFSCVSVISNALAGLPLKVYQVRPDGGKAPAPRHSLYGVLHSAPNPEMTSYEFREALQAHLLTWGNAYAEIELNGRGDVIGLWPLRPDRTEVTRDEDTRRLVYKYRLDNGEVKRLGVYNVLHIRGLSPNGIVGYSPIALARNSIGLSLGTEEYGGKFFANGARPGVVLEYPGQLSPEALTNIRESWAARHEGLENSQRIAILEQGMKVSTIGIPPDDAQFLETRRFQLAEIARMFRVPLHMINELTNATFSNIEHQALEFVIHTLRPWLVRWEMAIGRDLIGPIEAARISAEFTVDGLLRGDTKTRYDAYATGINWGWLSPNDVRRLENLDPIANGDTYRAPLNMAPIGQAAPAAADQAKREALYPAIADAVTRITRRAAQDYQARAEKLTDPDARAAWVREYRAGELADFAARLMAPLYAGLGINDGGRVRAMIDAGVETRTAGAWADWLTPAPAAAGGVLGAPGAVLG